MTGLIAGHIPMAIADLRVTLVSIRAGRIMPLAALPGHRIKVKALSELLTLHETVILGLDLSARAAFSGRPVSSGCCPMSVGKTLARREMVDMFNAAGIEVFYLRQRFAI